MVVAVTLVTTDGKEVVGTLRNISMTGAFVETRSRAWRTYVPVELRGIIALRADRESSGVAAMVVRSTTDGVAVAFEKPLLRHIGSPIRRSIARTALNTEGMITMKTSILIATAAACMVAAPMAFADDMAAPTKPGMNMGMKMGADGKVSQMEQNMKDLQLQMDKIHRTSDPKERQRLMDAHMQAMQDHMKAMRDMGGPMMKGGMHDRMMGGKNGGMTNDDIMKMQEMQNTRLDMMQMMMEQMMQRDQVMEAMPDM